MRKHRFSGKSIMEGSPKKKLYLFWSWDVPQPIPRNFHRIVNKCTPVKPKVPILGCVETIEVPFPGVAINHEGIQANGEQLQTIKDLFRNGRVK
jgi:hypothetical protein